MSRDGEPPSSSLPFEEPVSSDRIPIAVGPELITLRSQVLRLRCPAFEPPPRLVLAVNPEQLPALSSSILRITEVRPMLRSPSPRTPRLLGLLWLGEGCSVEIVGLPADEAFSPVWPLVLGGVSGVINASPTESVSLRACCEVTEMKIVQASALLGGPLDVESPAQIASLLRAALHVISAASE
jgi:hypothetical protein